MADFFRFRRMISPVLIEVGFWLAIVAAILIALSRGWQETIVVLAALLPLRIWCEFLILFFRMNETLTDIRNLLDNGMPVVSAPVDVLCAVGVPIN